MYINLLSILLSLFIFTLCEFNNASRQPSRELMDVKLLEKREILHYILFLSIIMMLSYDILSIEKNRITDFDATISC